jgi:hypothetical protein
MHHRLAGLGRAQLEQRRSAKAIISSVDGSRSKRSGRHAPVERHARHRPRLAE